MIPCVCSNDISEVYANAFLQYVIKRDGRKEPVHFDKITARITKLSYGLNSDFCDPVSDLDNFILLTLLETNV